MIRLLMNGMMMNFESYMALRELMDLHPLAREAFTGLQRIQAGYFGGQYEDFAQEIDPQVIYKPPHAPAPPGYSKRHRSVLH